MEINPRYVITRAISVILLIVVGLYALSYFKKRGRQNEIIAELKSLSSESSFFGQFTGDEAKRTMVRAIGLIAEANNLGIEPDEVIEKGLGLEKKTFGMETDKDEATERQRIIRKTLRANYENFRKVGYEADFDTLQSMKSGVLPAIRKGVRAGKKAEVRVVLDEQLSPGMDRVLANLEIRPSDAPPGGMTDVEIAAARILVLDLGRADVIDEAAEKRILEKLDERSGRLKK